MAEITPYPVDKERVKAELNFELANARVAKLRYRRGMEEQLQRAFEHYRGQWPAGPQKAQLKNQLKSSLRALYIDIQAQDDCTGPGAYTIAACTSQDSLDAVYETLMNRIADLFNAV